MLKKYKPGMKLIVFIYSVYVIIMNALEELSPWIISIFKIYQEIFMVINYEIENKLQSNFFNGFKKNEGA